MLWMPRHSLGPCGCDVCDPGAQLSREELSVSWLVSSQFPLALSHEVGSGCAPSALKTLRGALGK